LDIRLQYDGGLPLECEAGECGLCGN